jgi:thymidylate synthase ThyX
MISAEVILDSISPHSHRLTTFKLRYPRMVHSEFMTHRAFSRNASSNRAVPVRKRIAEARDSFLRAEPVFWGKEEKGMQSHVELEGYPEGKALKGLSPKIEAQIAWGRAAINAAHEAEQMVKLGVHKQIVNRLLEPFTHIDVVCTATEYMNFFGLRLDEDADPTMRALAEVMWRAYGSSESKRLEPGKWHLPFVAEGEGYGHDLMDAPIRISVARCARVSYQSHETGRRSTVAEDLKLYDRLLGSQPLHASPAEHQATPDELVCRTLPSGERVDELVWEHPDQHKNFIGWRQYRAMLPGESLAPMPEKYR